MILLFMWAKRAFFTYRKRHWTTWKGIRTSTKDTSVTQYYSLGHTEGIRNSQETLAEGILTSTKDITNYSLGHIRGIRETLLGKPIGMTANVTVIITHTTPTHSIYMPTYNVREVRRALEEQPTVIVVCIAIAPTSPKSPGGSSGAGHSLSCNSNLAFVQTGLCVVCTKLQAVVQLHNTQCIVLLLRQKCCFSFCTSVRYSLIVDQHKSDTTIVLSSTAKAFAVSTVKEIYIGGPLITGGQKAI